MLKRMATDVDQYQYATCAKSGNVWNGGVNVITIS